MKEHVELIESGPHSKSIIYTFNGLEVEIEFIEAEGSYEQDRVCVWVYDKKIPDEAHAVIEKPAHGAESKKMTVMVGSMEDGIDSGPKTIREWWKINEESYALKVLKRALK